MNISIAQVQIFFLVFTRIMAIIINIPNLGGSTIPNQVRICLGIILAAVIIPWTPLPSSAESMKLIEFALAIFREIFIGFLIGYAAMLTFGAITIAGETMGIGSGFGSDRIFNPSMEQSVTPLSQLFNVIASLFFLVINGHHVAIVAIQKSFSLLPVNVPLPELSVEPILKLFSQFIVIGIQIAFPIFAALLITDITLALLSRVAPQIQVYFLGLPLKIGLSMLAFGLSIGIMFPILHDIFDNLGSRMIYMVSK